MVPMPSTQLPAPPLPAPGRCLLTLLPASQSLAALPPGLLTPCTLSSVLRWLTTPPTPWALGARSRALRADRGPCSALPPIPRPAHHRCVVPAPSSGPPELSRALGAPRAEPARKKALRLGAGTPSHQPPGNPSPPARLPSFRGKSPALPRDSSLVTRVHLPGGSRLPGSFASPVARAWRPVGTPAQVWPPQEAWPHLPSPSGLIRQLQPLPPQPSQPRPPWPETAEKMPVSAKLC